MARPPKLTEAEFQQQVLTLARLFGWRVAHFRPARAGGGWRTPVAADGAGYPDLTLCRGDRLVFAELKVPPNTADPAQLGWLAALGAVRRVEAGLWLPESWDRIRTTLTER